MRETSGFRRLLETSPARAELEIRFVFEFISNRRCPQYTDVCIAYIPDIGWRRRIKVQAARGLGDDNLIVRMHVFRMSLPILN